MSPRVHDVPRSNSVGGGWPRAAAICLAVSMLSGCSLGFKRCATWDRVTDPDYMYPEHTLLHGYHRTTWESWPEHGFHPHWTPADVPHEVVPSGAPTRELPTPAEQARPTAPESGPGVETPAAPDEGYVPQATRPRRTAGDWNSLRRRAEAKLRANRAAEARRLAGIEVAAQILRDNSALVASPLGDSSPAAVPSEELVAQDDAAAVELTSEADAAFTSRFATLISQERKANWRPLHDADGIAEVDAAPETGEEAITAMSHEVEAADPATLEPAPLAPVESSRVQLVPADRPAATPVTSAPRTPQGDGEVRLKVKPAG